MLWIRLPRRRWVPTYYGQSLVSPYVAWSTCYLDQPVAMPLPWRSWIPTFWLNTYILERTYINWIYILWHLDIRNYIGQDYYSSLLAWSLPFRANIALCCYHLQLLPLPSRLIIVTEWTMMWYSSGGYWQCMHYAWGMSINYYVYLLRCPPTATFTDCYSRRLFSVLWWTRYTAALCCLYARWNQSSDAH